MKSQQLTKLNQENIDKWLLSLIHKIEEQNISREQILTELKELRKYFFKTHVPTKQKKKF